MYRPTDAPFPLEPPGPLAASTAREWEALRSALREVVVPTGSEVMRQGERGEWFAVIADGHADVTHEDEEGTRTIGTVGPGSVLGEIALLTDSPRSATVTATSPLTALVGGVRAFARVLEIDGMRELFGRTAAQRLAAQAHRVTTTLSDGTELALRPALSTDREMLVHGLEELSEESRRRRFFSGGRVPERVIDYLVDLDYVDHFAWVAIALPDEHFVGSARSIRTRHDEASAEIAFGVLDDYQRRGIGTLLVGALAAAAPYAGISRFTAMVLHENTPVRHMLEPANVAWTVDEPGVMTTTVEVAAVRSILEPALADELAVVAARVITASQLALA